jgi:Tol biopolymer transport system component
MQLTTFKISNSVARTGRCATLVVALLLAAAAFDASAANASPAAYEGASADGSKVFFSTTEKLVPGDTDSYRDVYMRVFDPDVSEYVSREVSTGPTGGNGAFDADFEKVSADGSKVFFTTAEQLVAADTDSKVDLYVRDPEEGTTELVSVASDVCGVSCGNGPADVTFAGVTANGTLALFVTTERFAAADEDSAVDIYARNLNTATTTLISAGGESCAPAGCGNEAFPSTMRGASPDGSKVFFATLEQLTSDDTDNDIDIYQRNMPGGPTVRISQGTCGGCGNANSFPAVFAGTSNDGNTVYFESSEGLVAGDSDGSNDVYRRASGTTTLVSGGTESAPANLKAVSSNGSLVLFDTAEGLTGADTNGANDIYGWSGGAPTLVTSGTCTQGSGCGVNFAAATSDASKLFFTTTEQLAAGDTDASADIYRVTTGGGGTPVLVSAGGNGAQSAIFNGMSADGEKVYYTTSEKMVPQDEDTRRDLYLRDIGGAATIFSSPAGVCPGGADCNVVYNGNSTDAQHVFFVTEERLGSGEDVDSEADVYERDQSLAETRLVSVGNSAALGPSAPALTGTSPASPAASTTPALLGEAPAGTSIKIYATEECEGAPVATGTAAELKAPGITVSVAPGSTTSFRATATDGLGDTSACSGAVTYRQENPPPPPPPPPPGEEGGGGKGGGGSGGNQPKYYNGGTPFVAPLTKITFGPSFKTRKRKAVFRFYDSTGQPGTKFNCRLDRRPWKGCGSPTLLKRLKPGKHLFSVKGLNAAGVWEPSPVKRAFKVVQ